jgi:hypothetical protein
MITLFRLLVSPVETWTAISTSSRGMGWAWLTYVLPLTFVCSAAEVAAIHHWGTATGVAGGIKTVPFDLAVRYGLAQFGLMNLAVFIAAFALQRVEIAFHARIAYPLCFLLVAYAMGPVYASRLLDMIPQLPTWLAWGAGMLLSLGLIYNGLPKALKIEAYGAFGLFLFSLLAIIPTFAVAHAAAIYVLRGDVGF